MAEIDHSKIGPSRTGRCRNWPNSKYNIGRSQHWPIFGPPSPWIFHNVMNHRDGRAQRDGQRELLGAKSEALWPAMWVVRVSLVLEFRMNGGTSQEACVRAPGEAVNTSCARDARCTLVCVCSLSLERTVCVAQCKRFVSFSPPTRAKECGGNVLRESSEGDCVFSCFVCSDWTGGSMGKPPPRRPDLCGEPAVRVWSQKKNKHTEAQARADTHTPPMRAS